MLVATLCAVLLINACSGTAPSRLEPYCGDEPTGGEASLGDDSPSCFAALNVKEAPDCGNSRIPVNDVWVIDLETPEQEHAPLLEQAGPYELTTEKPVAIRSRGSRVQNVLRAKRVAANLGCNLLLIGPTQTNRVRASGHPSYTNNGETIERYLLFKLGLRQDSPEI